MNRTDYRINIIYKVDKSISPNYDFDKFAIQ